MAFRSSRGKKAGRLDNLRASLLMIGAMLGFAIEDAFIKALSARLPTGEILMILGAGGAIAFGLLARASGETMFSRAFLSPLVITRNLGELVGSAGFVTAITLSPLTLASAIIQANPLVVTAGAALFLGEKVGPRRWAAIAVGLVGVLMVVKPGSDAFVPASLFAVVAVFGLGARDLATRRVPNHISTIVLAAYAFGAIVPTGAFLMLWGGPPLWPMPAEWALLAGGILIGVVAYYAITAAMRVGEISFVTPFRYTRLVFAMVIGIAIFGEDPDALTWAGAAVIIASGLYTFVREAQLRRRAASHAAAPSL